MVLSVSVAVCAHKWFSLWFSCGHHTYELKRATYKRQYTFVFSERIWIHRTSYVHNIKKSKQPSTLNLDSIQYKKNSYIFLTLFNIRECIAHPLCELYYTFSQYRVSGLYVWISKTKLFGYFEEKRKLQHSVCKLIWIEWV